MIRFPELSDLKNLKNDELEKIMNLIDKTSGQKLIKVCKDYDIKGCTTKTVPELKIFMKNFFTKETKGFYSLTKSDLTSKSVKDLKEILNDYKIFYTSKDMKPAIVNKIIEFINKNKPRTRSPSKSPPRTRSPSKSPPRTRSPSKSPPRTRSPSKSPLRTRSPSKSPPRTRSPSKLTKRKPSKKKSRKSISPKRKQKIKRKSKRKFIKGDHVIIGGVSFGIVLGYNSIEKAYIIALKDSDDQIFVPENELEKDIKENELLGMGKADDESKRYMKDEDKRINELLGMGKADDESKQYMEDEDKRINEFQPSQLNFEDIEEDIPLNEGDEIHENINIIDSENVEDILREIQEINVNKTLQNKQTLTSSIQKILGIGLI